MKIKFFIPAVLWAGLTSVISLVPSRKIPYVKVIARYDLDQYGHGIIFMIFGALLLLGFIKNNVGVKKAVLSAFLIAVVYGTILELIQISIPSRGFEWLDLMFNSAGALLGAWGAKFIFKPK